MGDYRATYHRSITDPEGFWGEQAGLIDWIKRPQRVLDAEQPPFYRWFPDATLNTCFNALDRHVARGAADRIALVYDSAVTDTKQTLSYAELLAETAAFAGVLRQLGVGKGDRVVVYMPMIPEAVVAMLACARLGAVHSVVFGGFAPNELAIRIDDATPRVIVTASCGIEPNRVVEYRSPSSTGPSELAQHQPSAVVLKQRPEVTATMVDGRDVDWDVAMRAGREDPAECVEVAATDPLYILTSGTTGSRRASCATTAATPSRWLGRCRTSTAAGPVTPGGRPPTWAGWSATPTSSTARSSTARRRCSTRSRWRHAGRRRVLAGDQRARGQGAVHGADRDPGDQEGGPEATLLADYDLARFATLFLAGERLDPDTYHWATDRLRVPVVDNWWQTETGWPIAANLRGLDPMEIKPGSPSVPVPGYVRAGARRAGRPGRSGHRGAICIRLPLPPGTLPTLWGDDERYVASYLSAFSGYYLSGDGGFVDADGYLYVMGRTDDVINVAGHRLSTGSMEAVIAQHPAVAECAVIGVADTLKGQLPKGFIVLKSGVEADEEQIRAELVQMVRNDIGAVASFRDVTIVGGLPKTRSGKILRKTMREIADGKESPVPSTIEDVAVLDRLRPVLRPEG
ncbi:MAG: AMP-binding protein [Nocardioides sp.]